MLSQKQFTTFNDTARFLFEGTWNEEGLDKYYENLFASYGPEEKKIHKLNIQDTVFFKTWKNDLISSITELISIRFENILIPHL